MTTTTNSQVDVFYKVRERQDSYTDIPLTRTLQYRKKSTGNHPRDVVVTYDWKNRTATYASFGNAEKPVEILPGSFDPLALFFVIRTHRLNPGEVIEIPITDGKKCIAVRATVAGRETLTIDGKVYDTYLVIPDMERLQGVVSQKGDPSLKIWFSADEEQVPVRIQSKVAGGEFCVGAGLGHLLRKRLLKILKSPSFPLLQRGIILLPPFVRGTGSVPLTLPLSREGRGKSRNEPL